MLLHAHENLFVGRGNVGMKIVDTKVNMANIQFSKFKYFNKEKEVEKQMLENGKNVKTFLPPNAAIFAQSILQRTIFVQTLV